MSAHIPKVGYVGVGEATQSIVPVAESAFWIPGLYANENSVTRMRDQWTLQRLCEAFSAT